MRRGGAGFTLIELLIALAIATAFLSGAYAAFNHVLKAHNVAQARLEAVRNARAAMTTISEEVKAINGLGDDVLLVGTDDSRIDDFGNFYGDGIDNDGDRRIDEEKLSGLMDTDEIFNGDVRDQHAQIANFYERPLQLGEPDLGDIGLANDVYFGRDSLIFRIFPRSPTADFTMKTVSYLVTEIDGVPNVLVRLTRIDRANEEPLLGYAPLAFDVLGFDVLYWNPNAAPADQGWVQTWDSSLVAEFEPPRLPLPASLYLRITLNADTRPHSTYVPRQAVETMKVETVVNIEQTINDALYPRPRL